MRNKRVFDYDLFLKRLYEVAGTTVNDRLTEMLNLPHGKFSKWKQSGAPSVQDLLQIADQFNCSVDYLLGLEDNTPVKRYTVRDVCRLITEIDKQYRLKIVPSIETEKPNSDDYDFYNDMYGGYDDVYNTDHPPIPEYPRVWISFSPHIYEYKQKNGEPIFEFNHSGIYITEFLKKYLWLKSQPNIADSESGKDMLTIILKDILNSVPDEQPPFPKPKFKSFNPDRDL